MRLLASFALFCSMALPLLSQEYDIRFLRPVKTGEVCRELSSGSSTQQSTVFAGGQVIKSASLVTEIELDADITVTEADDQGRPLKESLLIYKCIIKISGQENIPFAEGTVINAYTRDRKMVFEIDGKPLDEKTTAALSLVESLYTGGVSDEEIFGASEKKKVGDSWKIKSEAIPADLARHDIKVDKDKIEGTVRIEKLENCEGTDCLLISAEMSIKDIVPKLPEKMNLESSVMMSTISGLFPLDITRQKMSQTSEFKMQMTLKGRPNPESPEVKVITTSERKTSQKILPGKKK